MNKINTDKNIRAEVWALSVNQSINWLVDFHNDGATLDKHTYEKLKKTSEKLNKMLNEVNK